MSALNAARPAPPRPPRNSRLLAAGAWLVAFAAAFAPSAAAADFSKSVVFERGESGYPIFRIPAIVEAANGDLLAFAEARQGGDASEIDLVLKRSIDRGQTWTGLTVVQDDEAFRKYADSPDQPLTVGNPAPVVDRADPDHPGRIWLPFTLENARVFVTYSDDHGETWAPRREITAAVKRPDWGWYATGPVHGIQLRRGPHSGRLVVPCDHRLGDSGADRGPNGAHAILSDDHGATWRLGAIDDTYEDGLNANETTVVELNDGRLYFNTRDQNGPAPGARGEAFSRDGGDTLERITGLYSLYRPSERTLDTPVVQSALLRAESTLDGGPADVILFSGPDENGPTGPGRSDLRIRCSFDEARSWQDGPLIHEGFAAYSDLVRLGDGAYGVLFEAGKDGAGYQQILFARFTLADLTPPPSP
ncbi:Sialidase [Planctomycetes bacterium LzC2]|uniref:exo-alpha-sialidase n=2 Tax=Alienimonas chondri TaxID=2681879 RepID=A0ABX1V9M9_9PLAN|nr:Sialidase [Alienimonas chondri]